MVKFLDTNNPSNITVDSFLQIMNGANAQFLNNVTPYLSTYFSKNVLQSTADGNLDSVTQVVGSEGAYRYNLIRNAPIYFDSTMDFTTDGGDFGQELTSGEIDAYIIPDTVVPQVDDFIEVYAGDNHKIIFRIIDVVLSKLTGKAFYKVSLSFDSVTIGQLMDQTVAEFEIVKDDNGEFKVYESSFIEKITPIIYELNRLIKQYNKIFYSDGMSSFIFKHTDANITFTLSDYVIVLDTVLNNFIKSNNLNGFKRVELDSAFNLTTDFNEMSHFINDYMFDTVLTDKKIGIALSDQYTPGRDSNIYTWRFETIYTGNCYLKDDDASLIDVLNQVGRFIDLVPLDGQPNITYKEALLQSVLNHEDIVTKLTTDINKLKRMNVTNTGTFYYMLPLVVHYIDKVIKESSTVVE